MRQPKARRAASNATCGHAAPAGLLPLPRRPRPRCKRISKSGNGSSACARPVSNALTLTQESVPSGQRFALSISVEGHYSIFKRGMKGVYQHCKEKHLRRYLAERDFRYSNRVALGINDVVRADRALKGIVGKRLTYE